MAAVVAASAQVEPPIRQNPLGMNTLYGPTGLLVVPTAYTAVPRELRFGGTFADQVRGPSANWGVTDWIEIGGAFLDVDGGDDKAIANAKVTIHPANFRYFDVGVGIIDAADAINQTAYVVGSVNLTPPRVDSPTDARSVGLRAHAGVGTGMFQERLFGGAELLFADGWSLIGEYDSENFNAGVRYVTPEGVRVQAGVVNKHLMFGLSAQTRL